MKKIFKNPIFTFILGAVIFGSISTTFAYSNIANNISYISTDDDWDANNVSDAINALREIGTDYVYGELTTTKYGTWQEFNLGFEPRVVVGITPTGGGYLRSIIYVRDKQCTEYGRGSSLYNYTSDTCSSIQTYDSGFRWRIIDSSWGSQSFKYYAFK